MNVRFAVILLIIAIVGAWRVFVSMELPAWANFSPIGALALFSGSYFTRRREVYILPTAILLVGDLILMHTVYAPYRTGVLYDNWYWNYASFLTMILVGEVMIKKVSLGTVIGGGFIAALVHFIISNFGVWVGGGLSIEGIPYTQDWQGLIHCYIVAIPYFKNLLLGNLIFSALLFGGFELAKYKLPVLQTAPKT